MNRSHIREHLMVHAKGPGEMNAAPGVHVGTVDKVEGDFIKLTRNDSPSGEHRWVPIGWVDHVDERAVYLNRTADEFQQGAMTYGPASESGSASEGAHHAGGFIANGTGTSPGLLGDTRDTTSGSSMLSDPSRLPSTAGGTASGRPSGLNSDGLSSDGLGSDGLGVSGSEALGSAGGSLISDHEIGVTGADSSMGDRGTTNLSNPNKGGTTDAFAARGVGNTTSDQELSSGAGAASGSADDRNTNTGAQGNVSSQGTGAHVGQGSGQDLEDGVQGLEGYDTSYSGGSSAIPNAGGNAGGSAATPSETSNTNLDPALAGSDFDREAMGQAVDQRRNDSADSSGNSGGGE